MQTKVGDITYQATGGKTWADVIGADPYFSEFSIDSYYNLVEYDNDFFTYQNGNLVYPTDLILPHTYIVISQGGLPPGGVNIN